MLDEAQTDESRITSRPGSRKPSLWRYAGTLVLLACLMLLAAPVVSNIARFNLPTWATLATYMEKMARKDVVSAYSLYSPQAKEKISLSDLEAMTHGTNSDLLEGYKGLFVRDFHLRAAYDPKLPDFMADVECTIIYKGKSSRSFTATLVMINNRWVLESMQIDSLSSRP